MISRTDLNNLGKSAQLAEVGAAHLEDNWQGVLQRRVRWRMRRRARRGVLAAGATCLVLLSLAMLGRPDRQPLANESQGHPLASHDGQTLAAALQKASLTPTTLTPTTLTPTTVQLDDGSKLVVETNSNLEVIENTGRTFRTRLQRGKVHFDVRPHGPRRWIIEAGIGTVEVLGTRFTVDRSSTRLDVKVQRGRILVRSAQVVGGKQTLVAGQAISLPGQAVSQPRKGIAAAKTPTTPETTHGEGVSGPGHATRKSRPRNRPDMDGSAANLLARADALRAKGQHREAAATLWRLIERFESSPEAPLAAFTVARLELEALRRPQAAARALERALALGLPRALQEQAQARLVFAWCRANEFERARHAAQRYAERYPNGAWDTAIERWLARASSAPP